MLFKLIYWVDVLRLIFKLIIYVNFKLYVYEYINICSQIYIYIYIFVYINIGNPETVHQY